MNLQDNKATILKQLDQEAEPISLPDLLEKLGKSFKARSLRRWLNQLIEEGAVEKTGQKRATKYYSVGSEKKLSKGCFSESALIAIEKIKKPLFERTPIAYQPEWLESYRPNKDYYLPEIARKQLLKAGLRASVQDPAGTYAHQIFNRLLIDLSYNSARLEGNTYSLLDTERLLLHGDSAQGKLDEEKVMILNHKEAIRYLVDNAQRLEITPNTILTLHYLLSDGLVEPNEAGKVRRFGVRIAGSVYTPFEDPKRLEMQLKNIAQKAALIKDPFEESIFLLAHVSYLQAFIDVNKRTARLSANISLIRGNLVPLAFKDVQVDDYRSAMIAIYELQDIRPLADLYVYSYMRTCAAYDTTVKAMGFDEIRVRYRMERRKVMSEVITKNLAGKQMQHYINDRATSLIDERDRSAFIEDVYEDIEQMDESRLAGLGITVQELKKWLEKNH